MLGCDGLAGLAAHAHDAPGRKGQCRRCVASKHDPAIFDLGFLLAYKQLATPSRWFSIEDLAENLLTEAKQHINIQIEQRLSNHTELLKDRARYETYLATGVVPKGPTEDVRCWQEDEFNLPESFGEDEPLESIEEPHMGGTSQADEQAQKKRRLDFSSAVAKSAAATLTWE
jgi:hypothetical protein